MIVEKYAPYAMTRYTVVLRVEGLIKLGESAELFQAALDHVSRDADVVIVDLSRIDYIDSTGIGELVGILVTRVKANPQLLLSGVSDRLLNLIKLAGYNDSTRLFYSEDEALDTERSIGPVSTATTSPPPSPPPHQTPQDRSAGKSTAAPSKRSLKVFVCHASDDKPRVRDLKPPVLTGQQFFLIEPYIDAARRKFAT